MSNLKSPDIGWSERLAIMDHFHLDDDTAASAFGVTHEEVSTAKELRNAGSISLADEVDFSVYEKDLTIKTPKATERAKTTTEARKPVTATKPVKAPKKRGRKGSKIATAFQNIPTEPTSIAEFTEKYQVSIPVLKQHKRFDKSELPGIVRVRKDKASGELMVWREVDKEYENCP